ncbi:hypothetical protein M0812_10881 [Anaeramoeba flamelloides]|uniref:DUF1805 domain-containing protein n=1 Tax=Anaeramoeba flamelloides TaxID=1746091 RepID=A0AAV7ZTV1_9EUKA|nr:hypothetical protein M0812_10881 [Anaeramoeba flamelloides]
MSIKKFVYEKIDLKLPLLIIKAKSGLLGCGYLNVETFNKTGESCAIVSGVSTHESMFEALVKSVSKAAQEKGVEKGMTGLEALELMNL